MRSHFNDIRDVNRVLLFVHHRVIVDMTPPVRSVSLPVVRVVMSRESFDELRSTAGQYHVACTLREDGGATISGVPVAFDDSLPTGAFDYYLGTVWRE